MKKQPNKRYVELIAALSRKPNEREIQYVDQYHDRQNLLKAVTVALSAAYIVLVFYKDASPDLIYLVPAIITMGLHTFSRYRFRKTIENTLDENCDPQTAISLYLAFSRHVRRKQEWETIYHRIADALIEMEDFDGSEKVITLMEQLGPTPSASFRASILRCRISFLTGNMRETRLRCDELSAIQTKKLQPKHRVQYEECLKYPTLLAASKAKELRDAYDFWYDTAIVGGQTNRKKVTCNYHCFLIAQQLGDTERAEQHRKIVSQFGNTMACKTHADRKCLLQS